MTVANTKSGQLHSPPILPDLWAARERTVETEKQEKWCEQIRMKFLCWNIWVDNIDFCLKSELFFIWGVLELLFFTAFQLWDASADDICLFNQCIGILFGGKCNTLTCNERNEIYQFDSDRKICVLILILVLARSSKKSHYSVEWKGVFVAWTVKYFGITAQSVRSFCLS